MKVLILFKNGGRIFIRGFTFAKEGVPCPDWLTGPWADDYGNMKWELLEEFLPEVQIVPAAIIPTEEQIDAQVDTQIRQQILDDFMTSQMALPQYVALKAELISKKKNLQIP